MSRVYLAFLFISTIFVSVSAAMFSVSGLMDLFAGAATSVLIMAGSLEFSKFVVVGVLYRYWGHIHAPLRAYLIFATVTLMLITSLGIYGYLSNAYQVSSINLHTQLLEIESLEKENTRLQTQISELRLFVDNIPATRLSRKLEFQKEYEPKIQNLQAESGKLVLKIDKKRQEMLSTNTKVGPVVFLAKTFRTDIDSMVQTIILLFVLVFDPLAVSLVFCLNLIIRLREKYRNDEYKIGAHSISSPVDHRYKKSA